MNGKLTINADMVTDGSICSKCGFYFDKAHGSLTFCDECNGESKEFTEEIDKFSDYLYSYLKKYIFINRDDDDIRLSCDVIAHNILKETELVTK